VLLGRITTVSEYDVTLSGTGIRLPSVVMLRGYIHLGKQRRLCVRAG